MKTIVFLLNLFFITSDCFASFTTWDSYKKEHKKANQYDYTLTLQKEFEVAKSGEKRLIANHFIDLILKAGSGKIDPEVVQWKKNNLNNFHAKEEHCLKLLKTIGTEYKSDPDNLLSLLNNGIAKVYENPQMKVFIEANKDCFQKHLQIVLMAVNVGYYEEFPFEMITLPYNVRPESEILKDVFTNYPQVSKEPDLFEKVITVVEPDKIETFFKAVSVKDFDKSGADIKQEEIMKFNLLRNKKGSNDRNKEHFICPNSLLGDYIGIHYLNHVKQGDYFFFDWNDTLIARHLLAKNDKEMSFEENKLERCPKLGNKMVVRQGGQLLFPVSASIIPVLERLKKKGGMIGVISIRKSSDLKKEHITEDNKLFKAFGSSFTDGIFPESEKSDPIDIDGSKVEYMHDGSFIILSSRENKAKGVVLKKLLEMVKKDHDRRIFYFDDDQDQAQGIRDENKEYGVETIHTFNLSNFFSDLEWNSKETIFEAIGI